jgi:hypothetical protein
MQTPGAVEGTSRRADLAAAALVFATGFAIGAWFLLPVRHGQPIVADERVYLFQARMLASGHLSLPPPPLPEFFENGLVLVVPRWAARYFPGEAMALAPFVRLGAQWVEPCLSVGLAAALILLLLRRAGVPLWAAMAGAAAFLTAPKALRVWVLYWSQPTAGLWVLLALLCAARLADRPTQWRALALGACVGLAGLTRQFTGLAIAVALLPLAWRMRRQPALLAAGAAPLVLALGLALFTSKSVTGSFVQTPWSLYAEQYTPFDGPGFGEPAARPPERALPAHLAQLGVDFFVSRREHRLERLPQIAAARALKLADWEPTLLLLPATLLGLAAPSALAVPLAFAVLLFAIQLSFHAQANYYLLEAAPVMAMLTGAGLARAWQLLLAVRRPRLQLALGGLGALWLLLVMTAIASQLPAGARWADEVSRNLDAVERALEPARQRGGLVFFRYPPRWNANIDLGFNEPDLQRAPLVRALDLGPRNDDLRRRFPGRPAFLFEVGQLRLTPLEELRSGGAR